LQQQNLLVFIPVSVASFELHIPVTFQNFRVYIYYDVVAVPPFLNTCLGVED